MYKITPFKFQYSNQGHAGNRIFSQTAIETNKTGLHLIAGSSGSGKSTFLHLLKGIAPTYITGILEGEITFKNILLNEHSIHEFNNQIVYLFQNPFSQIIHSNPDLEFTFTLENQRINPEVFIKKKEEYSQKFAINHIWHLKTSQLSHGECQKLVLASLVSIGPSVILLDEPTAFLNPQARKEFYQILAELKKDHLLFVVDHHLSEIKPIADRIFYVNKNGEILENNNDREIAQTPPSLSFQKIEEKIEINIDSLSFAHHPSRPLINNINMNLTNGDVMVIKGENGMGKSTLLKLMSGILKPQSGKIQYIINNIIISKKSDLYNLIGFGFQNPENSFFYDTLKEEFSSDDLTQLKNYFTDEELMRSPYLFSEGQKRRISIFINLFLKKKIFFFDEPTSGLDTENKEMIIHFFQSLKKIGAILIIISHDEDFIQKVATKTFQLSKGTLSEIK